MNISEIRIVQTSEISHVIALAEFIFQNLKPVFIGNKLIYQNTVFNVMTNIQYPNNFFNELIKDFLGNDKIEINFYNNERMFMDKVRSERTNLDYCIKNVKVGIDKVNRRRIVYKPKLEMGVGDIKDIWKCIEDNDYVGYRKRVIKNEFGY